MKRSLVRRLVGWSVTVFTLLLLSAATTAVPASGQAAVERPTSCTYIRYGTSAQITFSRVENDGASRYVLQRKTNNDIWRWNGKIDKSASTPTTLSFFKSGFDPADTVRFRVFARDGAVKSDTRWCSNQWQTQARWAFNNNLNDDVGNRDLAAGIPGMHAGDVSLKNGRIEFNGNPGSIVIANVSNGNGRFNPGGSQLRWVSRFRMPQASVELIIAQHEQALADRANGVPQELQRPIPSWNVMQRGFGDNPGGQWKTQIVVKKVGGEFQAFAECIVRDQPGSKRDIKQRSSTPITGDAIHTTVCEFDDKADELLTTFDGQAETAPATPRPEAPDFGTVAPVGTTTCSDVKLGDSITIGNKPACGDIDPEDSFIGTIYKVEIFKR